MATEVSATEQASEVVVEEIKATGNTVNVAEESSSQSKDLEAKNVEEKVEEEDLGITGASATESKEMPESEKSADVAEDVKKEESNTLDIEPAAEVQEKEIESQLDITTAPNPQTEESEKSAEDLETSSEKVSVSEAAEEPAISAVSEEENVSEEEKPNEVEVAQEPAAVSEEVKSKELEVAEDSLEVSEEPATVSEEEKPKESKVEEEPAISAVSEEEKPEVPEVDEEAAASEKPTKQITVASSVPETDEKSEPTIATELTINAITTPNDSGNAEIPQVDNISNTEHEAPPETLEGEPPVSDSSNIEEISDKLPEVLESEKEDAIAVEAPPLNELKEVADGTFTSQEDQNASKGVEESLKEDHVGVTTDVSPVTEIVEGLMKSEDKVDDEMQEKAEVVEEPTSGEVAQSEGSEGVEQVKKMNETSEPVVATSESLDAATEVFVEKNESVEGDNTTSVETTRDLELKDSEGKKEDSEKAVEQNSAESAKNIEEIPKEAPAKPTPRNFFSKVKQSIVKVKKAIVGKSPNSKTITAEGNDDTKVK